MTKIINLNKVRKAASRATKSRQAAENATKYGLSKADKALAKARSEKAARTLDGKRRED